MTRSKLVLAAQVASWVKPFRALILLYVFCGEPPVLPHQGRQIIDLTSHVHDALAPSGS